jgi:hypothetical protein
MTMRVGALELVPFLLGSAATAARLAAACPLGDARFFDVLDPASRPFFHLVNAGNARAFGGLAMPAWVQLDCATLPTAMIGFAAPREALAPSLVEELSAGVASTFGAAAGDAARAFAGPIPIAEYCALPTGEPGVVVGFSLYSLVAGARLGVRAKALALRCHRAHRQIGLTQYDNSAVRTHCLFGPLVLLAPRAPAHSRPDDTFVYEVACDGARLDELIANGGEPAVAVEGAIELPVEAGRTAARVEALMARHGRLAIVAPGLVRRDGALTLTLRAG